MADLVTEGGSRAQRSTAIRGRDTVSADSLQQFGRSGCNAGGNVDNHLSKVLLCLQWACQQPAIAQAHPIQHPSLQTKTQLAPCKVIRAVT